MPSTNLPYTREEQELLLSIATNSIASGLRYGIPYAIDLEHYPPSFAKPSATFVTLQLNSQLRGCIGHLEASRPLAEDVSENAFSAAFHDNRFPQLTEAEFQALEIHISILSTPQPLSFVDEADLLAQIQPGKDGLILSEGRQRGTFLPSVWESLPHKADFLRHLKQKAGFPADYWSNRLSVERYTTFSFGNSISNILCVKNR
ncbi:MAG TPA: AmmeMemoRadiSam system protein A [Gammaproteobacteria bacterium]|nr:AmmeMemoRadiSam system protein A [Gammaproteobacteria bacterium]